jgi:O-antigen/teichoic acid export membrane protein
MSAPPAVLLSGERGATRAATRRQIRGSSLLLAGRLLSKGLNFAVQVLIVRALSRAEFGAFAWALSVVAMAETVVTFGLDRAVTRFVPIYHEGRDWRRMTGTVCLVLASLGGLGIATVLGVHAAAALLGERLVADPLARALLLVLVFLAPVQAIDNVLVGLFAVFASPRAIFVRRYVLAPGLKLAVVGALLVGDFSVSFLASGYLAAGVLGMLWCAGMLLQVLRTEGLLEPLRRGGLCLPWRPVLAFTVPLLSSDLLYTVMHFMDTVLLERFHGTGAVAGFRAVQPTAHMNALVVASFGTLYTPLAARLFARGDRAGLSHLYWQTALWIAVLTFPVFALTFALAEPLCLLLFGATYRDSATVLAVLAVGYYFNAALGMNGLTLKVYAKVGTVVALNLAAVAVCLLAGLALIPAYGALGAALGTAATLVLHNVLKQLALGWHTGVRLLEAGVLRVYARIALASAGLLALVLGGDLPLPLELGAAALASLWVLRGSARHLELEETLPELGRVPGLVRLIGGR